MGRLDGKVALITGGARGQGAAEGALFVREGATVVLTDVLDDEGQAVADGLGDHASYLHHDVTSEDEWASVVRTVLDGHGRIDALVNNAGIFRLLPAVDTPLEVWDQVVAVNQTGTFLGMRSVAPAMVEQGSGSIINISSVAGLMGGPMSIAYSATKWAVRGMTKVLAKELGASGVRVNSVHPGWIDTPMLDELAVWGEAGKQAMVGMVPMGRMAEADEVADVVLFLASDESRYCTGAELTVDGGMTA
jgi:3alpha(or 20beta)-hydroxysteroid dehydrogenase